MLLFAGFVGAQAAALFGGDAYVQRTANLTYAQYARGGFWQLLWVTVLTLLVLWSAAFLASRKTRADQTWIRALLGPLAMLALVVVASAVARMWAYQQAYGFTRLRLLVLACELWLGSLFLLVLVAGIKLRARTSWLPTAVLAAAVATLIGLVGLNPDRFIAQHNVDRYLAGESLGCRYLSDLSADAVPELLRLPEPARSCVLFDQDSADLINGNWHHAGKWAEWNLSRGNAADLIADIRADQLALTECDQATSREN